MDNDIKTEMAASAFDNQDITADILNGMAVDLGKTRFSDFVNSKEYAVDELNDITAALVGKGILTLDNMCKPAMAAIRVNIATGAIVFGNGVKIRIKNAVSIEIPGTQEYFVYAYCDFGSGKAYIVVSLTEPADDEYTVMLCEIKNFQITKDRRAFSQAKVLLPSEAQNISTFIEFTTPRITEVGKHPFNISVPFSTSNFRYLCLHFKDLELGHTSGPTGLIWYDRVENKFSYGNNGYFYNESYTATIYSSTSIAGITSLKIDSVTVSGSTAKINLSYAIYVPSGSSPASSVDVKIPILFIGGTL